MMKVTNPEFLKAVRAVVPDRCDFFSTGLTALDLFESYDIRSESWQVETSMLTPRCQHGSVEADGLIYVCGGRLSDGRVLDNCEVYNPSTKE